MSAPLSLFDQQVMRRSLEKSDVLQLTIAQLIKDLNLEEGSIRIPPDPTQAMEDLRAQLVPELERIARQGGHVLRSVLYRVDLPGSGVDDLLATGDHDALSAMVVLRCLQKVLTRLRFKGDY
ncbi:MAG TPA: hypothetical protein PKJ19_14830 [Flavobacteriales bacterium]|nr:hypothetical protein [Flavobacteriales bacterium]HNU56404.1 hypothetical protein [Flavobacteriales bacterium]